jgi:general L-amino acid transport system substrate-binding protein
MLKRLSVALIALALVAAACGDDDGATTETTAAGTTETTAAATGGDTSTGGDSGTDAGQADGGILAAVQARGVLRCGISGSATAFSELQPDGSATGFDADYCRYIAAAVLGDATLVEFTALTAAERFTAVQTGAVDVLIRNTTWTQGRDTEVGMDFAPTTFYDGAQVMARAGDGFSRTSTMADLAGASVCTNAGTSTEVVLNEVAVAGNIDYAVVTFEDYNQVMDQFLAGACDAVSTDGSGLAGRKATQQPAGEEWVIFPSTPISKEPLGPLSIHGDNQRNDIVSWAVYSSIVFDEKGITSANAASFVGSEDAEIRRLTGGDGELQTAMGLPADAWLQAVTQVGNYDEIFARNLNPVGLFREGSLNASYLNGGLIYAPPVR